MKTAKGTKTRKSAGERFALLASMDEEVMHTADLGNLWHIRNPGTLRMTLARYCTQGLLHRIQKGLYSLKKPTDLDPQLLGIKALHRTAYISCETVLFDNGVINQPPQYIALISAVSRQFTLVGQAYRSRKLSGRFLFNDAGIDLCSGVRIASLPRAVADTLYFNPKKYFDVATAIDWSVVRDIVHTLGYPNYILKHYAHT